MTVPLLQLPRPLAVDSNGVPRAGAKLYVYAAGTSTPVTVFQDAELTVLHASPIIANTDGLFPPIYTDGTLGDIKINLTTAADVQVPGYPIDNIPTQIPASAIDFSSQVSPAETAAGVTPVNFQYTTPGDLRRYGGDPTGTLDSSSAWQQAINVGTAVIPADSSFKIVTPATRAGRVSVVGSGPGSKLLCDSTVLTVTNGTGSVLDNFWMENLTAPYVITRDPAAWATPVTTAVQSNTVLGYQPTINDPEYATLYGLYGAALAATISPTIAFTGNASDVQISRIYGRFVYLNLQDLADSMVCDCDFRGGRGPVAGGSTGGGGPYGCVVFDNVTNSMQAGDRNRALRNKISYASFSGLVAIGNFDGLMQHNVVTRCGESGLKVNHGDTKSSQRMQLFGNTCTHNYFDGIDADSSSPASDAQATFHIINGNRSYRNGGAGINIDGQYNVVSGNHIYLNYRYGLWALCSYSSIVGNECVGNNLGNDASTADLLGGSQGNVIASNVVHFTASAGYPIYAAQTGIPHSVHGNYTTGGTNFFGNVGAIVPVVDNNLDATGPGVTPQCFSLTIANNAGTLQASFSADAGTVNGGNFGSRVIGAGFQIAIPTGTDASTPMAGGGKIGSANTNRFWLNTAAQNNLNSYAIAVLGNNTTGTAVIVRYGVASMNLNGVTIARPYFEFFNATTGAAFALTTANIGSGNNIQVQFLGKLA